MLKSILPQLNFNQKALQVFSTRLLPHLFVSSLKAYQSAFIALAKREGVSVDVVVAAAFHLAQRPLYADIYSLLRYGQEIYISICVNINYGTVKKRKETKRRKEKKKKTVKTPFPLCAFSLARDNNVNVSVSVCVCISICNCVCVCFCKCICICICSWDRQFHFIYILCAVFLRSLPLTAQKRYKHSLSDTFSEMGKTYLLLHPVATAAAQHDDYDDNNPQST